ncbi:MAG: hypothetical protein NC412_03680 [Roseburia sp.]|nr:hypothetical protein [Roseburia sp.]MCM1278302.1 hypothetical protein [Robinsoniella sp.]
MLNEERIKLMTKMAAYEENEGRRNMVTGSYFRGDYIEFHMLRSVISATLAYGVLFAMYIYYDFETFMQNIYKMDLIAFGKDVLLYYFIFVVAYAVISYIVYSYRYSKAKKSLKRYFYNLKQLSALYELESKKM